MGFGDKKPKAEGAKGAAQRAMREAKWEAAQPAPKTKAKTKKE